MTTRFPALAAGLLAVSAFSTVVSAAEDGKHQDDPTRILTRASVGYDGDEMSFSGSVGLDETRMVFAELKPSSEEFSLGGSWLFDKGILNVYINGDEYRNSYNVGTFVPLHVLGVDTGKWMVFPMGGASIIDAEGSDDLSYGAYLGGFAIRPISDQWSVLTMLGGSLGSDDYSSTWASLGGSYMITPKQRLRLMLSASEDSYRTDNSAEISYQFEF